MNRNTLHKKVSGFASPGGANVAYSGLRGLAVIA
jgi:hypothetical protein